MTQWKWYYCTRLMYEIDVFTVMCAILANTPQGNIQDWIKGRDAIGLRLGNYFKKTRYNM